MCAIPREIRAALFGAPLGVPEQVEDPAEVEEITVCLDDAVGHDLVHG
ncbi:hypothetical protein [Kribbella sp. NPDC048915]